MRDPRHAAIVLLAMLPALAVARNPLPTGFGPLALGTPWSDVEAATSYTELTRATSDWERFVYECGYRSAALSVDNGRLLVTAQDATVTALSYVTPIEPDSNVMKVAELVMKSYGQPKRATLRDELGTITIDQQRVAYVLLEYTGPVQASFAVSGDPLWEYRISIRHRDARRLENRTLRCAREREKAALKEKKGKKAS